MPTRRGIAAGVLLLALAASCWFLHAAADANGRHSWQDGDPPSTVTLHPGRVYHVSTHGGIDDPAVGSAIGGQTLKCTYSEAGGAELNLPVTPLGLDSRELHRIGSFIAPSSGPLTISCPSVGPVYIDDATGASFDVSGLLVLATVVFGFAAALVLVAGVWRRADEAKAGRVGPTHTGEDEVLGPSPAGVHGVRWPTT